MMLDGEKLVAGYLRDDGLRVVGKTPDSTATAWVRLTQLDARDLSEPKDHLVSYLLQLDCYAGKTGGQPEANTLGLAVRAALRDLPEAVLDDAVVAEARIVGHARIPDTEFTPARERVVVTVDVRAHPVAVVT